LLETIISIDNSKAGIVAHNGTMLFEVLLGRTPKRGGNHKVFVFSVAA
jgi:hypothetical protein